MSKGKSSFTETAINVVLLVAACGVLGWKYNDCKKKEMAAKEAAVKQETAAAKAQENRFNACLTSVKEADRNDCIRCTCTECLEAFEHCAADKECKAMSVDSLLSDAAPPPDNRSRIRFEQRAACMFSKCGHACVAKRQGAENKGNVE
jgi:hypothetical protein